MAPTDRLLGDTGCGVPAAGRRPDRGDGSFVNPVLPGDHPGVCVLRDGDDYYLSCASQQFSPGAVLWHSRDLVNWSPLGAALREPVGTVLAVHLSRHAGRYFLYLTVLQGRRTAVLALHADDMRSPWSRPFDLGLRDCLDASHVVAEDGSRHLFVNGIRRVRLRDDGLATRGALEHCYPTAFASGSSSGPRLFWRDGQLYLLNAAGGADDPAGPHTLAVTRSRSVFGPWEDCPFNPLQGDDGDAWTTGGVPSLVSGPDGAWWLMCHGHEAANRTLGRQAVLQPVDWGRDGWFRRRAGSVGRPQRKPLDGLWAPGMPEPSDDFRENRLGSPWQFFDAAPGELQRACFDDTGLLLAAKGSGLADCSPLTCVTGDASYEAELAFELRGGAQGGLALFHDARGFVGMGIGNGRMHTYSYGQQHRWMQHPAPGAQHRLRLTLRHHRISFEHAADDGPWTPNPWLHEVSALHLNRSDSVNGLRVALFAAGSGEVRMKRFSYRPLAP